MAKVTILALGHALVLGARGEAGGAPKKDSIWGVARIDNVLVTFSGRRGAAVLKFKRHRVADLPALMAKFQDKLAGKGIWYSYADKSASAEQLVAGLTEQVGKGYYQATFAKKVDSRNMSPKSAKTA